ncbi:MAG: class F sortase [Micromonosporaceae bacterium]
MTRVRPRTVIIGPGGARRRRARVRRRVQLVALAAATLVAAGLTGAVALGGTDERWRPPRTVWVQPCLGGPCQASAAVPAPAGPTRVRIPIIGVDASLELLALDRGGALTPPQAYARAGWYADGVVPGDPGPAVIAGHVDSQSGPAVFYRLHELRPGDLIEVERDGDWLRFRVTGSSRYPKDDFPAAQVYPPTPGPELRLVTCGGSFDAAAGSYRDNIVVSAVLVAAEDLGA